MSGSKRYYWLKLFDTFFDDPKVKKLKRLAGGDGYIVILLRFMLLTIKSNGVYKYQGLEITLAKELELILDEQEEHIQAVLIYLEKTGMLKEISQSSFLLTDVPKMLGSETTTAERMRKSRAKKKEETNQLKCNNVTPQLQNVPNCYTEIELDKELEIDSLPIVPLSKNLKKVSEREDKSFLSFVNQIRKLYKPDPDNNLYPEIFQIKTEDNKKGYFKIDAKGHLYVHIPDVGIENLSADEADYYWHMIHQAKDQLLPAPQSNQGGRYEAIIQ